MPVIGSLRAESTGALRAGIQVDAIDVSSFGGIGQFSIHETGGNTVIQSGTDRIEVYGVRA